MKRKEFIRRSGIITALSMMDIKTFASLFNKEKSAQMPALFVGHGNPMYAIVKNEYSNSWAELGKTLGKPKAILMISAHWLTRGTYVTLAEKPKTIHDFGGFPKELFEQQYPANGAVEIARETINNVKYTQIKEDHDWGLDHGSWSVLKNMYPDADIPVFQMSIEYSQPYQYHYELAKDLQFLRGKGVLVIGSGNITHNLRKLKFDGSEPFDWAIEFDAFVKKKLNDGDHQSLVDFQKILPSVSKLAHPSTDHYIPLLYTVGLKNEKNTLHYFNENFDMGSVSMRSFIYS